MNENIIGRGKELVEMDNFVTLVPELYRGEFSEKNDEAWHTNSGLHWTMAIERIRGAALFLMDKGWRLVGVTGYGMGGALSIAAAALVGELSAADPFYGIPNAERCDIKTINIPVQAHFGELDAIVGFSAPEDARVFEGVNGDKKDFEFSCSPADHGFTNPSNTANYNKESADLALSRTVKCMEKHLGTSC